MNEKLNKLTKEAVRINNKYKAISLDLYGMDNDNQRIIDEVKFQLDNLKLSSVVDEDLEDEGYTEKQIDRMKQTAIKHLENFLIKYETGGGHK